MRSEAAPLGSRLSRFGRDVTILLAAILLSGGAQAHSHKFGNLEIVHPWCIETPDAAKPVAVYMTILKRDGPQIRLSGVKKPLGAYDSFPMTLVFERAGKVEIEVMVEEATVLEPAKH